MSSHSAVTAALSMRRKSSSRSTSARNEQKTCPQMVASVLWKMGRVSSRLLAVREDLLDHPQLFIA